MAKKPATQEETLEVEETLETAETQEEEITEETLNTDEETVKTVEISEEQSTVQTLIYCGPSVKNVIRQYAHFNNGLPKKIKEYAADHPAVQGLIVPIDDLVNTKKNLKEKGTIENIYYRKIQKGE